MSEIPPHGDWRPDPRTASGEAGSFDLGATAASEPYGPPMVAQQPIYAGPSGGPPGYASAAAGVAGYGHPVAAPPPALGQPGYGNPPIGQPGYNHHSPSTSWVAQPRRANRTRMIIAAVVVGLAVVGGGVVAVGMAGHSGKSGSVQSAGAATSGVTPPPAVAVIPDGDGAALRTHLLPQPAGAMNLKAAGGNNGILTLDQVVTLLFKNAAAATTFLRYERFETAAEERFIDGGVETHVLLMQFHDYAGSVAYGTSQLDAFTKDPNYTSHVLDGVADGYDFELRSLTASHNHFAILMAPIGPIFIELFFYEPAPLDRAAELELMKQQIAALAP